MKKNLPRHKQCAHCPWKKRSDLSKITGYCQTKHIGLKDTIADSLTIHETIKVMACHHSNGSDGMYCIGWLTNQLGPGNNISLRLKMLDYDLSKVKTFGPQYDNFEDTLRKK